MLTDSTIDTQYYSILSVKSSSSFIFTIWTNCNEFQKGFPLESNLYFGCKEGTININEIVLLLNLILKFWVRLSIE